VGPSIRSNHNENTLLLREGELGHPEVEKPQNAPRKLMSNEMGYEALISGVKGDKKPDTVVMIFMPPPAKDLVCSYFRSFIGYLPFGTGMGYRRSGSS
jgi:hypothetical protein